MSEKSKKLLKEALSSYLKDDGATDTGAYRDAITDLLHIMVTKERNNDSFKSYLEDEEGLWQLRDTVIYSAFSTFMEEQEVLENKKMHLIPKRDLPLYVNHKWKFQSVAESYKLRLKGA